MLSADPYSRLTRIWFMPADTLYYDGRCPLCSSEIRRLARHAQDRLQLVDVHSIDDPRGLPDKRELLARLHLLTSEGTWLTGLDANIRAWHHTPYRRLWQALRWPLLRPLVELAYAGWLRHRNRVACRLP